MAKDFKVDVVFKGKDGVSQPVRKMTASIGRFTKVASKGLGKLNRSFRRNAVATKKMAITTGILGGIAVAASLNVIKAGADFEQAIVGASARMDGAAKVGSKNFKLLEDAALKAGAATEFTATQSAGALENFARSGFDTAQAVASLPLAIDMATASGIELNDATRIASKVMGGWGLKTKDAIQHQINFARVTDVLTKTVNSSDVTMEQISQTMKRAAPLARQAGVEFEEIAAMTGILADSSIEATRAGTGITNMLIAMVKGKNSKPGQIFNQLGVDLANSAGKMRPMSAIIGDLTEELKGLTDMQKLATTEELFGKIPLAAVNILIEKGAKGIKDYTKTLKDAKGTAAETAGVMRNTLGGSFKKLTSMVDSLKIGVAKNNSGELKDNIDELTETLRKNGPEIIKTFSGMLGAVVRFTGKSLENFAKWGEGWEQLKKTLHFEFDQGTGELKVDTDNRNKIVGKKLKERQMENKKHSDIQDKFERDVARNMQRQDWEVTKLDFATHPFWKEGAEAEKKRTQQARDSFESDFKPMSLSDKKREKANIQRLASLSPEERTTAIHREVTESKLIIEDKTGKAKFEGNPSKNMSLMHSGGL